MANEDDQRPADYLYSEGMKYGLEQDASPAAASLARANFQQAAAMGHAGAVRALAHLIYEGRGGPQDKERGCFFCGQPVSRAPGTDSRQGQTPLPSASRMT